MSPRSSGDIHLPNLTQVNKDRHTSQAIRRVLLIRTELKADRSFVSGILLACKWRKQAHCAGNGCPHKCHTARVEQDWPERCYLNVESLAHAFRARRRFLAQKGPLSADRGAWNASPRDK